MISSDEMEMVGRLKAAVEQELVTTARLHHPFKLKWTLISDDSSPWLLINVEGAEPYDAVLPLPREFAMWRRTRAIYKIVHSAVLEDPVMTAALKEHGPVLTVD